VYALVDGRNAELIGEYDTADEAVAAFTMLRREEPIASRALEIVPLDEAGRFVDFALPVRVHAEPRPHLVVLPGAGEPPFTSPGPADFELRAIVG